MNTSTTTLLYSHMLRSFSTLNLHKTHINQVRYFLPLFSFFTTTSIQAPWSLSSSSCSEKTDNTHIDICSISCSGIAKSVLLNCSHPRDKKKSLTFTSISSKEILLRISHISPETARRFRRVSELKPEDVLEILLGFDFHCENSTIESRKAESLWEIFNRADDQSRDFKHLPRSCEVMASMLIRVGLLREVELLISMVESRGIPLDIREIFSNLIEGYASFGSLERAISIHDRIRGQGLVPSRSCYHVLFNLLVKRKETGLAFRVLRDMMEVGFGFSDAERVSFDNVTRLLCSDEKVQEARNVVKMGMPMGLEPSSLVINEIVRGYCEKKDFNDIIHFFAEMKCPMDILSGNKIVSSLCSNFGTERVDFFLQEMERLGFIPDEITFAILIGWSCREGELKNAFNYLSEILSRGLKPDVCSYNALISGVFKEGLWKHARDILLEMFDSGTTPNMLTFKVLLAGYCRTRQFDEVKATVVEMANHSLIQILPPEDLLSKAFMVLGLNPLTVRVKRDNDVLFSKTEFFDNLGNGLYLETNIDEFEKTVCGVLDDSMIPDFNSFVIKECETGNLKAALQVVDEMNRWGQELSLSALSALVKGLCASRSLIKAVTGLLEKMPKLANQLDQETLNLLVQAHSKKGFVASGRIIFEKMFQKHLTIEKETYISLLTGLCKKENVEGLQDCWELARKDKWLPGLEDYKSFVRCLCYHEMLKEVLELLETMLETYPHVRLDIWDTFLEIFCVTGHTSIALVLVEKVQHLGCIFNHIAYSHLIRGFILEKQYSKAFMVLDIMVANNLVPSLDVSVQLISQLGRAGRIDKVLSLKEICLREHPSVSDSVYGALIDGFCKIGKVGEAANLFQVLLSKGLFPDTEVYNTLVQGYCKARSMSKVGELLGVVIRRKLNLSISSYRNLVQFMCMKGRVLWALSVKELMLKENNSPCLIIYNILLFYLFSMGNSLLVITLLDEIQKKGLLLDKVSYNFLVYGFCQCRDVSSSMHYLKTMIYKEFRPNNRSLRTIIKCLCDEGELEKALELSQEMELRGWVHGSVVQNSIVEGLLSHGNLQEAENFLDRMTEKGLIPESINYDNLIKRFCCYGRLNKAVDLLNIMLKKGNVPNSASYDSIICGFCTCKKLDRAMDFYTEMLDNNLKPSINTWDVLVQNFCKDGQTTEAEKLLDSMVQMGETPTREMYCSLINRHRSGNNLGKASELLRAMQQIGYDPDFETHWSLISNLSNSSEKDNGNNDNSGRGFLSRLLSKSGFAPEKDSKVKLR